MRLEIDSEKYGEIIVENVEMFKYHPPDVTGKQAFSIKVHNEKARYLSFKEVKSFSIKGD